MPSTSVEVTEEQGEQAEEREGQAKDVESAERPVSIDLSGEDYTDRHPNGTTLQVVGMRSGGTPSRSRSTSSTGTPTPWS